MARKPKKQQQAIIQRVLKSTQAISVEKETLDWGDMGGATVIVTKSAIPPELQSRQIDDMEDFTSVIDRIIEPFIPFETLLNLSEDCSPHAACILAKSTDAVGQGWRLRSTKAGAQGERDEGKEIALAEQLKEITPEFTFQELLHQASEDQGIYGGGSWECVRKANKGKVIALKGLGDIGALYPLPSLSLRATKEKGIFVQSRGGKTRYFKAFGDLRRIHALTGEVLSGGGKGTNVSSKNMASEVITFRTYSRRSDHYGMPTWISAIPAMAELAAIREYNISWFSSGGTADRVLIVKATSKDVAQAIATDIESKLKQNAGRGHITVVIHGSEDLEVEIKSMNAGSGRGEGNRERQFRGGRQDLVQEVLWSHQVPAYRIGLSGQDAFGQGGSSAEEVLRAYRYGAIEPIQLILESRLMNTLFGPDGLDLDKSVTWELQDLTLDTMMLNMQKARHGVSFGMYSPNQARELVGDKRVDDKPEMDEHYIAVNMQPLKGLTKRVDEAAKAKNKPQPEKLMPTQPGVGGGREKPAGTAFPEGTGK